MSEIKKSPEIKKTPEIRKSPKTHKSPGSKTEPDTSSADMLEERYHFENQFLKAISQGQTQKAMQLLPIFNSSMMEPRAKDPIRNFKNYMIILNTLMRKAAESGGVHPLYLDQISGLFARKIEGIANKKDFTPLMREMTQQYCLLVQKRCIRSYSLPIQKLITTIDCDLTADLSLHAQAARLHMNASYLSALFRQETGSTYTEYVNQRRMEHAALLLLTTSDQVQAIAQQCGVSDVNYFNRLFKKAHGCTPGEYRRGYSSWPEA